MPLLSYDPMEDGNSASANLWNVRLSKIHDLFNGNLDAANLANGAVTTPKIADGAVTSSKLNIVRSTDANGWSVVDYGGFKSYRKVVSHPGDNFTINSGDNDYTFFSIDPPIGVTATVTNTTVTQVLLWGATSWNFIKKGDQTTIGGDGKINFSAHVQGTAGTTNIWFKYIVEVII